MPHQPMVKWDVPTIPLIICSSSNYSPLGKMITYGFSVTSTLYVSFTALSIGTFTRPPLFLGTITITYLISSSLHNLSYGGENIYIFNSNQGKNTLDPRTKIYPHACPPYI